MELIPGRKIRTQLSMSWGKGMHTGTPLQQDLSC